MARVHRKTTRSVLLATVAVSALAGCVTVQRPPAPGPPAGAARLSEPHPDARTRQVVQAPAREALEMVTPSRPTKSPASASPRATPTAPAPRGTASPDDRNPRPVPGGPAAGRTVSPRTPDVEVSEAADALRRDLRGRAEVCALGREYGRWPAGSPEEAICEETYGR